MQLSQKITIVTLIVYKYFQPFGNVPNVHLQHQNDSWKQTLYVISSVSTNHSEFVNSFHKMQDPVGLVEELYLSHFNI